MAVNDLPEKATMKRCHRVIEMKVSTSAMYMIRGVLAILTGALLLLIVALLVNNLSMNRKYPEYWL